jgi:hypothetical protein
MGLDRLLDSWSFLWAFRGLAAVVEAEAMLVSRRPMCASTYIKLVGGFIVRV